MLNTAVAEQLTRFKEAVDRHIESGMKKEKAIYEELKKLIRECKPIHFDGNGYSDEWKAEAARRGLDCETSTPLIFDRYLTADSIRMFESTGVLNKVEIEARTEVKWETYTKKIQIEGRVLGDLTMNHIVPIASRYEAMLLDKVYKMAQIGGLDASADIDLLKKIQGHTAAIQTLTIEMIEARKKANRIENARAKAIAYHDTVEVYFEEIRRHIDKLEEIIDDQMWTLPKLSGTSVHQIGSVIFSQVVRTPRKHFRGVCLRLTVRHPLTVQRREYIHGSASYVNFLLERTCI